VEHTDAMGYRIRLQYDGDEELIRVTNQAGDSYDFELDLAGRLKVERTFSGTRRHFVYDKAGRVKQHVSGGHRVVKLERDALGRVIAQTTTSPVLGGAPTEELFHYDPVGDLIGATTPGGEVRLARDVLGRIVDETTRVEATKTEASVRNVFDRSGLRTERATSLAHRTSYRYDRAGDLIGVAAGWQVAGAALKRLPQAQAGDFEITLARDAIGQEIARRLPGGVASRWGRDAFGRPIEQRVVTGASTQSEGRDVLRKGYAWSAPDQIASMFDLDPSGHAKGGSRYEHDPRGYLIRQIFSDGTEIHRAADPVGNLFRGAEMNDRVYGKGGVLKRVGSTEIEHDADGNLIKKTLADGAVWQYRWDAQGRLSSVSRPDGKEVSFSYDAFGRRLSKTFDGRTTEYIWDGNDLVHERVREGEAPGLLTTWVFEPGTFAPLAKIEGRKRFGVVSDHLGTPVVLTTEAGALAWKAQLDIYGVPREEAAGVADADRTANPWRFPGQYEDAETGLYYNRFRYYDPELGRYLSEDPIGLAGGVALFGYVESPDAGFDALGLETVCAAASRTEAFEIAQAHAQVPRVSRGAVPIPFDELKGPSRGANGAELQRRGATNLGRMDPATKAQVFDHPDGHPHLLGPDQPAHHSSPHVHAVNSKAEKIVITYPFL
ncbi:MAG: RHS repeat protein, partial [Myxococcales bacterium]|nr:RHS repeat protein [Myxococcales bacterium]